MFIKNKIAAALVVTVFAGSISCSRKWDDHNQIEDPNVTANLYEVIASNSSLSKFKGYLDKTGYADTLKLSKNYTVWAPADAALQVIDASLNGDASRMKKFVAHHITRQKYFTTDVKGASLRLQMLDGKYVYFSSSKFDIATISGANRFTANGILHIISDATAPIANCWDYVDSLTTNAAMAAFLKAQKYNYFDSSQAEQIGVDPDGLPVYKEGTGNVVRNKFLDSIVNISNEAKEYTVFVLANTAWEAERSKLAPFYKTGTTDSTNYLSYLNTSKDLVTEGSYAPDQLPDSIVSQYGIKTPVKKSAIKASYRTSNGYVYYMDEMDVPLKNKIPQFIIQGENYSGVSNTTNSIFIRTLVNPNTGGTFKDVFVYDHRINKFYLRYTINQVYTTKYKVYWVVANNNRFTNTFSQRLAMGSSTNATFAYVTIQPNVYDEVYLGEYTVTNYGPRNGVLNMYLVSADIAPTTSNQSSNSLFLDYIRLEPVLQ